MSSLRERVDVLGGDLLADPPRISAYHDLPFAIFRYDPSDELLLRKELGLLATRLENAGRRARFVSLGAIMWRAIQDTEGVAAIAEEERALGFERAQRTVSTLLSDPDFSPLPLQLERRMQGLDPAADVVFLVRAAALAPSVYHMSKLLDELHGRTRVPTILCYPGSIEGTTGLTFMAMRAREAIGNYRVKIY
jgi:hypothetical protein